jgi:hypothetical protein
MPGETFFKPTCQMKKSSFTFLVWLAFAGSALAQPVSWASKAETLGTDNLAIWAAGVNGGQSTVYDLAADDQSNLYAVGIFSGNQLNWGQSQINPRLFYPNHNSFLLKHDKDGKTVWLRGLLGNEPTPGSPGSVMAHSVVVGSDRQVYVTGSFSNQATFGNVVVRQQKGHHFFLAKYDTEGNCQWVKYADATGLANSSSVGYELAVDRQGHLYLTGAFRNGLTFDGVAIGNEYENATPTFFVLKLAPSGRLIWHKSIAQATHGFSSGITVDAASQVYVVSLFNFDVTIPPLPKLAYTRNARGRGRIVVAKLDSAGKGLWARDLGEGWIASPKCDLALDAEGSLYVPTWAATDNADTYLFKLDRDGQVAWSKSAANNSSQVAAGQIAIAPNGWASVAVRLTAPTDFNGRPVTASQTSPTVAILRYDATGQLRDLQSIRAWELQAMQWNPDGSLYLAGATDYLRSPTVSLPGYLYDTEAFILKRSNEPPAQVAFDACQSRPGLAIYPTFTSVNPLGPGDSLQLVTKFVPGTTYEWYRDEQRLEGASDFRLTIPISRRGRYQVVLQQPPNCNWRTNVVNFNPADYLGPLATLDDELAQQIRVWPNPFAERVVVELAAGLASATVRLALTDALGRPVAHGRATLPGGGIALQLGQLPKGVYLLTVAHHDRMIVKKLVRE